MKEINFRKSMLDYFVDRKKSKKNKDTNTLVSSLSNSTPIKPKRQTGKKDKERRFVKYHLTPLTKSNNKLNFKPSIYNMPEMESPTDGSVSVNKKTKKKEVPIVNQNKNKERYSNINVERPLNDIKNTLSMLLQNNKTKDNTREKNIKEKPQVQPKEIISNKAKFLYQEPEKSFTLNRIEENQKDQERRNRSTERIIENQKDQERRNRSTERVKENQKDQERRNRSYKPQQTNITNNRTIKNSYANPIYNTIKTTHSNLKNWIMKSIANKKQSPTNVLNKFSPNNKNINLKRNTQYLNLNTNDINSLNVEETNNNDSGRRIPPNSMTNYQNSTLNNNIMNVQNVNKKMNAFTQRYFSLNKRYQRMNSGNGIRKMNLISLPEKMERTLLDNGKEIPVIPGLKHGGIVDKPTAAILGEAGPEVAAPLDGLPGLLKSALPEWMFPDMPISGTNSAIARNNSLKMAADDHHKEGEGENTAILAAPSVVQNTSNMSMGGTSSSKFVGSTLGKFRVPDWRTGLG